MKNFKSSIFMFLVSVAIIAGGFFAVPVLSSYAPPAPTAQLCIGGTYYDSSNTANIWYGKLDTVGASATDTFKASFSCSPKSITYTIDAFSVAGATTTNFVVALYGSGNNGKSYQSLATYTLTPSATYSVTGTGKGVSMNYVNAPGSCQYIVNNSFGGNPETHYMWVATNTAASTRSWLGSCMWR